LDGVMKEESRIDEGNNEQWRKHERRIS